MYLPNNMEQTLIRRKHCFMRTRIFLSASLTLTLTALTIIYTIQQDIRNRTQRAEEQEDMEKYRKQSIYDAYLDDISKHLLSRLNDTSEKTKLHIRAKTLNALLHLDPIQKTEIIFFLYENYLIRSNYPELAIDLSTANLTACQFIHPCNLNNLYLPGVMADKIIFNRCQIRQAVFSSSSMVGAQFIYSQAAHVRFDEVNLTDAIFINTNNLHINFINAILVRSSFTDEPEPQGVNFVNADLFKSNLTDQQLAYVYYHDVNIFFNTRFPNGSFSDINSSQLIFDGGAELSCSTVNENAFWKTVSIYPSVNFINASKLNSPVSSIEGDCYFQCPLNFSERYQFFSVKHFSIFIDSGQVWFNLSAYFSCPFLVSSAYIQIGFYTEALTSSGSLPMLIKSEANSTFHYKNKMTKVPETTRVIYITVGAHNISTNIINPYCLVDNIKLNFFIPQR